MSEFAEGSWNRFLEQRGCKSNDTYVISGDTLRLLLYRLWGYLNEDERFWQDKNPDMTVDAIKTAIAETGIVIEPY